MKKLIEKHIGVGAGIGIKELQYPVKRAGEDFDCMIGNTRTTWACLQGYLNKQLERDDPHEKLDRVFQEENLGRIFKVLRRDILDFTDMDNQHHPGTTYQHNIFIKRIKGFITQVFPYLTERLQKDERALFCLIKSALTGEKLWEDLYSDHELWRGLTDEGNIRRAEDEYYEGKDREYEGVYLKGYLATHFPRVKQEVKEELGKETIMALIRKGVLHTYNYAENSWKLPKGMEEDPEVVYEAVRAGHCSYGFPLPHYALNNDVIVAEHIMTLHMRKLNEGYLYMPYDHPAAMRLVRDFETELRCLAEDRGKGEDVYELAEMIVRVYEQNHHCRSGLKDLEAPDPQAMDAVTREKEELENRVRALEETVREKEKLEAAVCHNNEQILKRFVMDLMPVMAVHGRLSGSQRDLDGRMRELCLSYGGRVFYFTADLLNPMMMEKLGEEIRRRAGEVSEEMGRKLMAIADACDHKVFYDRRTEPVQSFVAEQNPSLLPISEQEEQQAIFFDSGLSL